MINLVIKQRIILAHINGMSNQAIANMLHISKDTVKLDIGDAGYQKYQMAVFTSAYGNFRYAKLYLTQDTAAFQETHADFFAYSHGAFQTMIYDNMRVAVR